MTELNSNTADTAVICEWPSNLAAQDWETGATKADVAAIGGGKKSAIICGTVKTKYEDDGKENIFSQMHMTESCVTAKCSDKTPILSERSANVTTGGKSQRSRSNDGKDEDKLKKRSKKCSYEGCDKYVRKGGVCWGHGAKYTTKRCSYEGCDKFAKKGGVCHNHGAERKKCVYEGCDKYARKRGTCRKHGANRLNPGKQVSTAASLLVNLSRNV
ncbi:hypothetical protein QTG54_006622 [Skeletonema marinoi]|uniref:WRKY19-like zinc finger domain-containing protein n=1 Tax=Skeletonema marinoi TaxID=267567 RepID=A0AAD9DEQ0_9STRA|nr:hypothetical protein QTG54_006622 [Skeletonema marinoi]